VPLQDGYFRANRRYEIQGPQRAQDPQRSVTMQATTFCPFSCAPVVYNHGSRANLSRLNDRLGFTFVFSRLRTTRRQFR
jgi:hypothetical protein